MHTDLKILLDWYISKAFDNEQDFLKQFFIPNEKDKLIGCYMSANYTRLEILGGGYRKISTIISTDEFIAWVESIAERGRFDVLP